MRRRRALYSGILRFVRNVVLLDLAVLALAALAWAIFGERTLLAYADSIMCGAGLAIVIGIIGLFGGGEARLRIGADARREFTYRQASSVSDTDLPQPQDRFRDIAQSYGLLATMVTVGLTTAAIAILIIYITSRGVPTEFMPWIGR